MSWWLFWVHVHVQDYKKERTQHSYRGTIYLLNAFTCKVNDGIHTVQEYLLARVIFGEFVCEKQLADFILAIWATTSFFSSYEQWLCGRVHVVINNFGDFNIGEFSEKSPIANINSSPINRLVRYALLHVRIKSVAMETGQWKTRQNVSLKIKGKVHSYIVGLGPTWSLPQGPLYLTTVCIKVLYI